MTPVGRPRFEVIVGTADAAARRLVSAETIRALTGIADTVPDATLNLLIDGALAQCAKSCKLARAGATPITLAEESVRATWSDDCWVWSRGFSAHYNHQPSRLFLPWRAPITAITVTEGDTELVENTDFRLLGAGVVERIGARWSTVGNIVVDYVAGWVLLSDDPSYDYDGEPMPADLVQLIADQVRMVSDRGAIDLNLRSEVLPNIGSWTFNTPGGDAIDTSGLLRPLYDALEPFRAPPVVA